MHINVSGKIMTATEHAPYTDTKTFKLPPIIKKKKKVIPKKLAKTKKYEL